MMNKNHNNITIVILFFLAVTIGFTNKVHAANCGGVIPCDCGDTVIENYTLTSDMTCTGDCLIVGADGITIDGNNHTITGDGEEGNYGIDNSDGYDTIIIQNFNITRFGRGILLNNCTGNTIQNNITTSNSTGIHLYNSSSNTLTGNAMFANTSNLFISGSTTAQYNNTIDTTNTVEGKPVYYFYNNDGTEGNPLVYDGNIIGDIGIFWCISCDYVQVKNAILSVNNPYGVYFRDTTHSTIQNITVNSNPGSYGIHLYNSSSNILTSNTVDLSGAGISLSSSSSNTITDNTTNSNDYYGIYLHNSSLNSLIGNTITSNSYGIYLSSSSSNNLSENIISNNRYDIYNTETSNTYYLNHFYSNNSTSKMFSSEETTRIKNVGESVDFDISMFDPNGSPCSDCSYEIITSPLETLSITKNNNQVVGSFVATRPGTCSVNYTITDLNLNTTERIMLFFIGDTDFQITRYYLRGITPTHEQPTGTGDDIKSLLLTAPSNTETWFCDYWTQNFPDELPTYPLADLSGINIFTWYKQSAESGAYIGIQRYGTYGFDVDYDSSIDASANYLWINRNFADLNWVMDYPQSWYWIASKLKGTDPYCVTFPTGYEGQPEYYSHADFTYQYTTTPAIKSISDNNIMILSATADPSDTGIINVVLEDYLTSDTSTMDIVLSSPIRIDISIDEWNISPPYYKEWREEASGSGIIGTHIISGFAPNSYYVVKKNSALVGLYLSNGLGEIIFTCVAGSVFTVESVDTVFKTENNYDDNDDYSCFLSTLFASVIENDEDNILCKVRDFRDSYLLTNPIGEVFVSAYYKTSPRTAVFISEHPILKKIVRTVLTPLIWMSEEITE